MQTTNDYITVADKYIELLNEDQHAIKCLLQFLFRNFYNNSFADQTVHEAQAACDRYLYRNKKIDMQYRSLLKFVIECRRLLEMLKDRRDDEIYKLVKETEFVLLGAVLPSKNHEFFLQLIALSGFGLDVYFKYLRNMVKGL